MSLSVTFWSPKMLEMAMMISNGNSDHPELDTQSEECPCKVLDAKRCQF